jgi:hypothetical protein
MTFPPPNANPILPRLLPHFNEKGFSQADRNRVSNIILLFAQMGEFTEAFKLDLELFDYAEKHAMNWVWVACRDAALNISEFMDALALVQNIYQQCTPLVTLGGKHRLRPAIGALGAYFPSGTLSRNVMAHRVEHLRERDKHALPNGIMIQAHISNRTIYSTHKRKLISFELSEQTFNKLREVYQQSYSVLAIL